MSSFMEPPSRPLSLHIDGPASASPFPSPSSSFLPPPVPGAHEFAVKPPPRRKSTQNELQPDSAPVVEKKDSGNIAVDTPTPSSDTLSGQNQDIEMLSPTTPTPASIQFSSAAGSATNNKPPSTPTQADIQQTRSRPTSRVPLSPVLTSSPSLASSRAAPPSPAASRRTSTISARSSKSNASDSFSPSNSRRQSKRSSAGIGGFTSSLGLTSTIPESSAAKRQSTLSALSTGSENGPLPPQNEGDEDSTTTTAEAVNNPTTPTITTISPSNPITIASPDAIPTTTPTTASTITTTPTKPRNRRRSGKIKIHIRDFAYKKTDDKYRGLGSDVPKPNRFARLNKKLGGSKKVRPGSRRWSNASESTGDENSGTAKKESKKVRGAGVSRSSEDDEDDDNDEDEDDDDDDDDDEDNDGWFRRGMGRFGWSFGLSNLRKQVQQEEEERQRRERAAQEQNAKSYPSRDEMDFNFSAHNPASTDDNSESGQSSSAEIFYDAEDNPHPANNTADIDVDEEDEEELDPDQEGEEDEDLFPGQYRAMFAFEPEGTAEMRLIEDQIVKVVGRGGGVGWAVVVVPEGAEGGVEVAPGVRHALVPESYLEVVELD